MARITVEDCLDFVANRFELVLVGSKRARQLAVGGKDPHIDWESDKPTVVALREIEQGLVNASILEEKDEPVEMLSFDMFDLDAPQLDDSESPSISFTAPPPPPAAAQDE